MHTSHSGKRVQRTGWHTPHTAPRVCAQAGTSSCQPCQAHLFPGKSRCTNQGIPEWRAWGACIPQVTNTSLPRAMYCSSALGHFPPSSICRNEKAAAFLERRMRSWSAFPSPRAACPTLDVLNLTSLRKPTTCWVPHGRGRPSRGILYLFSRNFWKYSQHLPHLLSSMCKNTCQPCGLAHTQAERQVHR